MKIKQKKVFLKTTIKLMKKSKLSVKQVSDGTGFSRTWLHRLVKGDFPNPGVVSIETLHDYLLDAENEAKAGDS